MRLLFPYVPRPSLFQRILENFPARSYFGAAPPTPPLLLVVQLPDPDRGERQAGRQAGRPTGRPVPTDPAPSFPELPLRISAVRFPPFSTFPKQGGGAVRKGEGGRVAAAEKDA